MNEFDRPEPYPKPVPYYEHEWSKYPDLFRVSFDNGKTIVYEIRIEQPEPRLREMLDSFTKTCFGGYKYKNKGRGKRTGRIKSDE